MSDPYAFLSRLPDAIVTERFEKHPGIFISAALVEGKGRNVFLERIDGPGVPEVTYTLNIGGRGALVYGEQEFRDIVSIGLTMFEVNQPGFVAPAKPDVAPLPDMTGLTGVAQQTER